MQSLSQQIRQILLLIFCLGASASFSYHTIYGRYGLETRAQLMERLTLLKVEMESLETVRSKLENDVALLNSEPPNSDFLEEVAGDVLGYVRPADRVLLIP